MFKRVLTNAKYTAYRFLPRLAFAAECLLKGCPSNRDKTENRKPDFDPSRDRSAVLDEATSLHNTCCALSNIGRMVDVVGQSRYFPSQQNRSEIVALLEVVRALRPKTLCEIGTERGGSLALLSYVAEPDASILSVDIGYTPLQLESYKLLVRNGPGLTCLAADSHSQDTLDAVKHWLAGRTFDFLFIDGDHSFDGVSKDFEMYALLVRRGGIIAFHDIVPDFHSRYGIRIRGDAGHVYEFWKQLKQHALRPREFVEHRWQDGKGIGVVEWQ